ncbi:nitroreductase-like [hydrothermal vent metagenome]|uniref:Nitroreductase-like n=1 Tax=hydrothermal vent metagenome TaxID=652676 RepID=A0A3B0UBU2_9ZZZZ
MNARTLFNERRSVNFFDKTKEIDMQTVKEIINLAVLAPSAFNLQPWRIIVVKSDSSKERLFGLSNTQDKVKEAAVNLILVGKKNAWDNSNPVWQEMLESVSGNQKMVDSAKQAASFLYGSSEERSLKFAESNTGLLAMAIMIAAKEFGVDTHPMSGIDFDGIHKEFGLSEDETVVMTMAMGYADKNQALYPRRPRLTFDEIATVAS